MYSAIAWSPNSDYVVVGIYINGGQKGQVLVFDINSGGKVLTYDSHNNGVKAIAWSPDGRQIAAGTSERTVQVIDVANGRKIATYAGRNITFDTSIELAWSPDGKYLAESIDRLVQIRDINSGKTGPIIVDNGADQLLWSRDGKSLGIAVQINSMVKQVRIWDVGTGEKTKTVQLYGKTKPRRALNVDKYEFLVYKLLKKGLDAGDIFIRDSRNYKSFQADILSDEQWQQKDILIKKSQPSLFTRTDGNEFRPAGNRTGSTHQKGE